MYHYTGLTVSLIIWAGFILTAYFVGKRKNRVAAGIALAALLGIAGIIIMACLPEKPSEDAEVQRQYDLQQAEASRVMPPREPPARPV